LDDVHIGVLVAALVSLILLSAFFSASETAMMALNRYRLSHLADSGHKGAKLAQRLLASPDRLLGVILVGNNAVNFSASAVAGLIAFRLFGEAAIAFAVIPLTLVVLIFAEVGPKTVAALYPERIAFPVAHILAPLLTVVYPVVWLVTLVANGFLRLLGISLSGRRHRLSADELRSALRQAGSRLPVDSRDMLLQILELESINVEDLMVPRNQIEGIELEQDWDDVLTEMATAHHTRLPLLRGGLDNIVGVVHLRRVFHLSRDDEFDEAALFSIAREPHFVAEGTSVVKAMKDMQAGQFRFSLVVDEYGDLLGLITLEEILEEIIGEFTRSAPNMGDEIVAEEDGSFLVSGSAHIRDLNRKMDWDLPMGGPKTINGLIVEHMEDIPTAGTTLLLAGYPVEVLQTRGTAVTRVRISPQLVETVGVDTDPPAASAQ
jgi:Mg2+/Co2+ transporter CorB